MYYCNYGSDRLGGKKEEKKKEKEEEQSKANQAYCFCVSCTDLLN